MRTKRTGVYLELMYLESSAGKAVTGTVAEVCLAHYSPVEGFQESPQIDDAARFVRGASSGAFKAGKHPPSSSQRAAHPRMTRPALATSRTAG